MKNSKNRWIFCIAVLLAVCVVLFIAVKNGWFGQGVDEPFESGSSGIVSESTSSRSSTNQSSSKVDTSEKSGDNSESEGYTYIYVPDDEGFVLYKVKDMPADLQSLIAQAASLGGLSEGTELVNVNYKEGDSGIDREAVSYAEIIISGKIEDSASDYNMQTAIIATLSEFYPNAVELKLVSDNNELTFSGKNKSAQQDSEITDTIEISFSE